MYTLILVYFSIGAFIAAFIGVLRQDEGFFDTQQHIGCQVIKAVIITILKVGSLKLPGS